MTRRLRNRLILATSITLTAFCAVPTRAASVAYELETLASGLDLPWSIAPLSADEFLLTSRRGAIWRLTSNGELSEPFTGVPETYFAGQGGFFDLIVHPDFASNGQVFLAYASGTPDANRTTILRARVKGNALVDTRVIHRTTPTKDTPQHYGGKLLFLPDGTLLVTTGDGFEYRDAAQDRTSQLGKTLRMDENGEPPADNPYVAGGGDPKVWTWGHRNPQGLAADPVTGTIYLHEHGPRGGDEVNILKPGHNYGWPAITYGVNYTGAHVSPFTEWSGMEQPIKYWVPSIAPSGLTVYRGDAFPDWNGDLFVGALVDREVRRLEVEAGKVVSEEALFSEIDERIRDIRTGPDGLLYIVTDGTGGKVIRVRPAAP